MTIRRLRYLTLAIGSLLCKRSSASFLHHPQRTHLPVELPRHNVNHHQHSSRHHNHLLLLRAVSRPQDDDDIISQIQSDSPESSVSFLSDTVRPIASAILKSFLLSLLLLTWEDYTCSYTLPSRSRVDLPLSPSWGASTVHGLGFGRDERLQLLQRQITANSDDLWHIPSYNEVGLEHRQERVARWRSVDELVDVSVPIHTLCQILQTIVELQGLAENYQWDNLRTVLHTAPVSKLEAAASSLRKLDPDAVIGFDWGSCAWRHCGALADAQEAIDELDYLLGVLEPYEALFCLDVVERSVRDMLTTVPWKQADTVDIQFWKALPVYQPHQSTNVQYDEDDPDGRDSSIDEAYARALFELRVD
jgi:hypothetical protein